jgi:translation initiation factor 6
LKRIKIFGGDHVGLYIKATNSYLLYHSSIPKKKISILEEELGVPAIPVYLINTLITSPFIAGNRNGIVLPHLFEDYAREELVRKLKELDINIGILEHRYTSLGNLVLANDKGAIVSPVLPISSRKIIAETLDIEVVTATIGRFSYVGSLAVSNNNGVLVAPVLKDDEAKIIEDVLKVSTYTGTINGGVEFISSGVVANDRGVVVGTATTGRELMVISQAFGVD